MKSYLWQHPLPTCLHAQAAIVHPEDEIRSFPVSALTHVKFGLIRGRRGEVSVQAEFDSHAAGLSEGMNKRGALASAANTYIADVCPCSSIVRLPPINEASEGLDNLDGFPTFGKRTDREVVGKFLAGSVKLRLEELCAGHDESGKQERTPRSDIMDRVKGGVEEVDKRVQAQKHEVEEDSGLVLIHDSC